MQFMGRYQKVIHINQHAELGAAQLIQNLEMSTLFTVTEILFGINFPQLSQEDPE